MIDETQQVRGWCPILDYSLYCLWIYILRVCDITGLRLTVDYLHECEQVLGLLVSSHVSMVWQVLPSTVRLGHLLLYCVTGMFPVVKINLFMGPWAGFTSMYSGWAIVNPLTQLLISLWKICMLSLLIWGSLESAIESHCFASIMWLVNTPILIIVITSLMGR